MNVLFIGDVVGKQGREVVKYFINELQEEYDLDFVIANLENASHGKGLNRSHFLEMLEAGVDAVTMGNHLFGKKEINEYINDYDEIIRPYNLHKLTPGKGSQTYKLFDKTIRVTNLVGRAFMSETNENPFDALEDIVKNDTSDIHIVDFHAEATGEKQALAWAFDGKITALLGTHTHVQTNDTRLLKQGTLYCSDVGMCGPYNGILGANRDDIIRRTWTGLPTIFGVQEDDEVIFSAVLFIIDDNTNKVIKYKNIYEIVDWSDING